MQKVEQTILDNPELEKLFQLDQSERKEFLEGLIDESILFKNDEERRKQVQEMITQNKINTALDYYRAAMIFQHGKNIEDIQNAKKLAEIGLQKGEIKAKWLTSSND